MEGVDLIAVAVAMFFVGVATTVIIIIYLDSSSFENKKTVDIFKKNPFSAEKGNMLTVSDGKYYLDGVELKNLCQVEVHPEEKFATISFYRIVLGIPHKKE